MKQVVVVAALMTCTVRSSESAPIVIESAVLERDQKAATVVRAVEAELGRRGYAHGGALARRVEEVVSSPGDVLDTSEIERFKTLVSGGYDSFVEGDFATAIATLTKAKTVIRSRLATVARQQELRDQVMRYQIGLALAFQRQGDNEKAIDEMAELLRSHPDREISRKAYGPEPADLAKRVREELDRRPRGSLMVEVLDDPGGVVFVNERYVSVGRADLPNLHPGRYRVFVAGKQNGRIHEVDVAAGQSQSIQITVATDAPLQTTAGGVALVFASDEERGTSEAAAAAAIGSAVRAAEVVVVSVRDVTGRRAIVGTVYAVDTARPVRTASLNIEPLVPGPKQIGALARFLASGETSPDLQIGERAAASTPARAGRRAPWYADRWGWAVFGSGVALAVTGGVFLISASSIEDDANGTIDELDRKQLLDDADARRSVGTILLPIGAAVATIGVIKLALRDRATRESSSTGITFGPRWIGVRGSF